MSWELRTEYPPLCRRGGSTLGACDPAETTQILTWLDQAVG